MYIVWLLSVPHPIESLILDPLEDVRLEKRNAMPETFLTNNLVRASCSTNVSGIIDVSKQRACFQSEHSLRIDTSQC